jgi:predicted amidohydrolase YtcJ
LRIAQLVRRWRHYSTRFLIGIPAPAPIHVFTINAAYAVSAENRLGSVEAGKLADMIVLNRSLFEIPQAQIRETRVLTTILNGAVVYDRERMGAPDSVIDEGDFDSAGRLVH